MSIKTAVSHLALAKALSSTQVRNYTREVPEGHRARVNILARITGTLSRSEATTRAASSGRLLCPETVAAAAVSAGADPDKFAAAIRRNAAKAANDHAGDGSKIKLNDKQKGLAGRIIDAVRAAAKTVPPAPVAGSIDTDLQIEFVEPPSVTAA